VAKVLILFYVRLGLDHLIGTPALKPYMHGYFISLKLYDTARVIANPFVYAEHREKKIREKMEKMAETRIRTKKDATAGVKVNKALAEKILKDEERARRKQDKKKKQSTENTMDVDDEAGKADEDEDEDDAANAPGGTSSLLNDPRFSMVFNDPEYQVDEQSREYALLNPSTVAQRKNSGKTAVEDEDEESDRSSSDGLGSDSDSKSETDSDDEGGTSQKFVT
jgi:ribosome biogenesis protein ENP2